DVSIINKIDSADQKSIDIVENNIKTHVPSSEIIKAESTITIDNPDIVKGKKVLIVEDGPTLTHGEMKIGAGSVAAERYGASEIIGLFCSTPAVFLSRNVGRKKAAELLFTGNLMGANEALEHGLVNKVVPL